MNKLLIILAVVAVLVGLGLWLGGGNVKRDVNGENMIGEVVKPTEAIILGEEKVFDLVGSDFEYDVKEIRVKRGETVTINLTVAEGMHDWRVDEFGAMTEVIEVGEVGSVTFVADIVGTFEYYCSVGQHRANGMVGNLIVEE
jgi:cytochrome c oxidase subunit 2